MLLLRLAVNQKRGDFLTGPSHFQHRQKQNWSFAAVPCSTWPFFILVLNSGLVSSLKKYILTVAWSRNDVLINLSLMLYLKL